MSVLSTFLWFVPLLLVLWGQQAQSQFQISSFPSPLTFTSGASFTILCDYDSTTHEYVEWRHPLRGSITSSFGRYDIVNAGNVLTLSVQRAFSNDSGEYLCIFREKSRPDETRTLSLIATHYNLPNISSANGVIMRASTGQSVTFHCNATYSTSLQWINPFDRLIRNTSDGRIRVYSDRLVINNVLVGDNGTYECRAENPVGSDTILVHLFVKLPPSTEVIPPIETAMEGSNVVFTCHVSGFPLPTSVWLNSNRPGVTEESQERVNSSFYRHRLIVTSVSASNIGEYECRATNPYGSNSSTARLELLTEFFVGPPEDVTVHIDGTNITVSWNPPTDDSGTIDSYTITWQALNSSTGRNTLVSYMTNDPERRSYRIQGLERLTQYSLIVYATRNRINGRGENSERINFTTPAVPDKPISIRLYDPSPNSVRVEWTLASNDGGSEVTTIRISTRIRSGSWNDIAPVDVPYNRDSPTTFLVDDLISGNEYQIRIQAVNAIGASLPLDSEFFTTPPFGLPGAPSNVTAKNITSNSAVICWIPSNVGKPFTSLKVEGKDVDSTGVQSRVWRMSASSDRVRHQEDCQEGFQITDLEAGKCYTFKVSIVNSQGTGNPSAESESVCIHPCVDDNCLVCVNEMCGPKGLLLPDTTSSSSGLSTTYIAIIAVCITFLLVVVGSTVFLLWCCCASLRHLRHRKMVKFPTGELPPDALRRESARSTKGLIEYHNETRNGSLQTQSSIGNNSVHTLSSQSSETGDFQETPNTATSLISNEPIFFNPSQPVPPPKLVASHPASVPVLHSQSSSVDYPQSNGRIHHSGSTTLTFNGSAFPIYPIPEHPNQSALGSRTIPHHTARKNHQYPSSTVGELGSPQEQEFEMTENPLNASFEKEKIAEFSSNTPNYSFQVEEPEDEIPPPVPSYHGRDDLSEVESEMSIPTLPISTPHFGESYSQPSNSPQLMRGRNKGHLYYGAGGAPGNLHGSLSGMKNNDTARFNVSMSDDEEDLEFYDNDAYQTIVVPGRSTGNSNKCPPPHVVNGYTYRNFSTDNNVDENSQPRFAIKSQERGAVFETVEFRH